MFKVKAKSKMLLLKLTATKVRVKLSIVIYSECVWRMEAVFAIVDKCVLRSVPSFHQACPFLPREKAQSVVVAREPSQ